MVLELLMKCFVRERRKPSYPVAVRWGPVFHAQRIPASELHDQAHRHDGSEIDQSHQNRVDDVMKRQAEFVPDEVERSHDVRSQCRQSGKTECDDNGPPTRRFTMEDGGPTPDQGEHAGKYKPERTFRRKPFPCAFRVHANSLYCYLPEYVLWLSIRNASTVVKPIRMGRSNRQGFAG
jgi:hypothetical protein